MAEKQKILIIEDDGFLLQMYSAKLELENFNVLSATDGAKGLKIALEKQPDLIILDLKLPEMDGFQVLSALKRNKKTKNIPVVVLTNLSQKRDINNCLKLGAADYMIKAHFVPAEVISQVKRNLLKNQKTYGNSR